jgi:hypothetical protein
MSDYRDTRGGAYDHVNDFGNPEGLRKERKGPLNKDTGRRPKR